MALSRRGLLKVGAATTGWVSFAGCLGDGSSGATTATEREPLSIDAVLARERPDSHGDVVRETDGTYEPGETVWLYVEPAGVAVEETPAGERRVVLRQDLQVTDPHGSNVVDDTLDHEQVLTAGDDRAELFLLAEVRLPEPPHAGEHELSTTVVDETSGEEATATTTFTVEGRGTLAHLEDRRFSLSNPTFCQRRPLDGECERQPDASYEQGETVWVRFAVEAPHYENVGNGVLAELEGRLKVTATDGTRPLEERVAVKRLFETAADLAAFHVAYEIPTSPDAAVGPWTVQLLLNDPYGSSARASATFDVA